MASKMNENKNNKSSSALATAKNYKNINKSSSASATAKNNKNINKSSSASATAKNNSKECVICDIIFKKAGKCATSVALATVTNYLKNHMVIKHSGRPPPAKGG